MIKWNPIADRPFAFGNGLVVPIGHIEPWEWRRRFLIGFAILADLRVPSPTELNRIEVDRRDGGGLLSCAAIEVE